LTKQAIHFRNRQKQTI